MDFITESLVGVCFVCVVTLLLVIHNRIAKVYLECCQMQENIGKNITENITKLHNSLKIGSIADTTSYIKHTQELMKHVELSIAEVIEINSVVNIEKLKKELKDKYINASPQEYDNNALVCLHNILQVREQLNKIESVLRHNSIKAEKQAIEWGACDCLDENTLNLKDDLPEKKVKKPPEPREDEHGIVSKKQRTRDKRFTKHKGGN